MRLLIVIPGILDPATRPGWDQDVVDLAFAEGGLRTLREKKRLYPFPHWNRYVANPRAAKLLAAGAMRSIRAMEDLGNPYESIHMLMHSNGNCVGAKTLALFAAAGVRVDSAVFMASALDSRADRNGLLAAVESGTLGRAVAWCSEADIVIRNRQRWPGPYGSHGTLGHQISRPHPETGKTETICLGVETDDPDEPLPPDDPFATRWFPGYGHSEWTRERRIRETFARALRDLGVPPQP